MQIFVVCTAPNNSILNKYTSIVYEKDQPPPPYTEVDKPNS